MAKNHYADLNSIVIIHSRNKFYDDDIYWYEFVNLDKATYIPSKFIQVPGTPYYEYGGYADEALTDLVNRRFTIIYGKDI